MAGQNNSGFGAIAAATTSPGFGGAAAAPGGYRSPPQAASDDPRWAMRRDQRWIARTQTKRREEGARARSYLDIMTWSTGAERLATCSALVMF
eukprot:1183238-Prorocentrum_minimum.AAC.1